MKPKLVFTGGGTAGHVTPNLSLIEVFFSEGWDLYYIGSEKGVEHTLLKNKNIPFYSISSGKLRRYWSWSNFVDPFKIIFGVFQSYLLLHRLKPDAVFSKGGFVSVPVVIAAWLNRIPVIVHESDLSPGLANKICFPFASKICITFKAAKQNSKYKNKKIVTGTPIRKHLFQGNKERVYHHFAFNNDKPCVLIIGGSQGAQSINQCVRSSLPQLLKHVNVIHLCGQGKLDESLTTVDGYQQIEYANDELADYYAASDIVISRSGANALYEILALSKPHILIPLPRKASRGDQIQNAEYFRKSGISYVIHDEELSPECLLDNVLSLLSQKEHIRKKIRDLEIQSATDKIAAIIKEQVYVQREKTI